MPANDIDRPAADPTRRISLLATSTLANAPDGAEAGASRSSAIGSSAAEVDHAPARNPAGRQPVQGHVGLV